MDVSFNGGDDLVIPLTIYAYDEPVDLGTGELELRIWSRGKVRFTAAWQHLADIPAEGEPHGRAVLDEEQTSQLPRGRIAFLQAVFQVGEITTSTGPLYLTREL